MKTEFLVTLDSREGIATNILSFNNLLMSNNRISISKNIIRYDSQRFIYEIQMNPITDTDFICYHITVEYNTDENDLSDLSLYTDLLRDIKKIFSKFGKNIEIIWDDINFYYSKIGYPLIYEIENLMRKLLTKFMLFNVGVKWEQKNIPKDLAKNRKNNVKEKFNSGLLYQLDFIELSTFLFKEYQLKYDIKKIENYVVSREKIPYEIVDDYIPKSNWDRYFKNVVQVEGKQLKKKWSQLYEYRCKIAHNNKFTIDDYQSVRAIVSELKEYLEKALDKVSDINVEFNKKEYVLNSYIETVDNNTEVMFSVYPNRIQEMALEGLKNIRKQGNKKGLVIFSTGMGKTTLSAFDVKEFSPRRSLFITHLSENLEVALNAFRTVLGGCDDDYGILCEDKKITTEKYLFTTIQRISKDNILYQYDRNNFDYIVIPDFNNGEIYYKKVVNYFNPKFLLGITSIPKNNIYEFFDYNIAYEINFLEAVRENVLCPFKYHGVADMNIKDASNLKNLVSDERVEFIIEKIKYYRYPGKTVKGVIFVSQSSEAKKLEYKFNESGFRTKVFLGHQTLQEREIILSQLKKGELDYIITVGSILENSRIPPVNQVVLMHKKESASTFIRELGRVLRNSDSRKFVQIVDFIGDYSNNYVIPIALTGDSSLKKNDLRKKLMNIKYDSEAFEINFDRDAMKLIMQSIDVMNNPKEYRESYEQLKNRLGRIPKLIDFIKQHSVDPVIIAKYKGNYPAFLNWLKEETPVLTKHEREILTFLSNELLNGKRNHELLLLNLLIDAETVSVESYQNLLKEHNYYSDKQTIESVRRILSLAFFTQNEREKYGNKPLINQSESHFSMEESFKESIQDNSWFRECVFDIIHTSTKRSELYNLREPLTYNEAYGRKDVCRLLNWENNETGTMYGYRIKYNTCPIFVNYHKDDTVTNDVKYEDELIDQHTLLWYTRPKLTFESKEVQEIMSYEKTNLAIHVFVQKEVGGDPEFIYLGRAFPKLETAKELVKQGKNGKDQKIVSMEMSLEKAVPLETYDFIKQK